MERIAEVRRVFGERVRALREQRGWQLDDVGKRLGKSRGSMSRIETGKQNLTLADIVTLAIIFDVAVAELFSSHGTPPMPVGGLQPLYLHFDNYTLVAIDRHASPAASSGLVSAWWRIPCGPWSRVCPPGFTAPALAYAS
jgi:transcriptional regulator with XRE-family HTH domain